MAFVLNESVFMKNQIAKARQISHGRYYYYYLFIPPYSSPFGYVALGLFHTKTTFFLF